MTGRLQGKVAIIVGAGQQPGDTVGNGRAVLLSAATGLVGSPSQDTKGVVTARALISGFLS